MAVSSRLFHTRQDYRILRLTAYEYFRIALKELFSRNDAKAQRKRSRRGSALRLSVFAGEYSYLRSIWDAG